MYSKQQQILIQSFNKGYRVNQKGTLIGPDGTPKNTRVDKNGYLFCTVKGHTPHRNDRCPLYVHRLVAYEKYGERLFRQGITVRHLNGRCQDNSWINIGIGTWSENMMDIDPSVRQRKARKAARVLRKLSNDEAKSLLKDRAKGYTYKELSQKYGVTKSTISYLVRRKLYKDL